MGSRIVVGIADYKLANAPDTLVTYALGSCVGISLYDAQAKLGGLAHIMLPDSGMAAVCATEGRMKFADTAIPDVLGALVKAGADGRRLTAKIAGGANMFRAQGALDADGVSHIGQKNVERVRSVLGSLGIPIVAAETGENYGRTLFVDLESGKMIVQSLGRSTKEV